MSVSSRWCQLSHPQVSTGLDTADMPQVPRIKKK